MLREGADDLERTLLAAARQDGPPDRSARARTLAALKAASRTAAVVGAGTAGLKGLSLLKPAVIPWPAIGALGFALIVGGGALLVREPAPTRAAAIAPDVDDDPPGARGLLCAGSVSSLYVATVCPPSPALPPDSSGGRESTRLAPFRSAPAARKEALSASPPAGTMGGSGSESAAPPPIPPSSLRQEAALLESVRESLAASRFDRALASLDEYDARFASGALEEEGAVLRVEALLASGYRDEARRVTADFERRHPASSYAPRMRARVDPQ